MPTTKSSRAVALRHAAAGERSPTAYTSVRGRKGFASHQLFAILTIKAFLKTDYHGVVRFLRDFAELRADLGLVKVPHFSTLSYAEQLLKKSWLTNSPG